MARFWFVEGHVDLEYAAKKQKQKQPIAPKSPTKIIYVIMIYNYKRNPTKKPIHTTHTHNNLHISSKKSNKWKKHSPRSVSFIAKRQQKQKEPRGISSSTQHPHVLIQVTLPFRPDFFHHMLVPGSFVQARKNVPCESRLHIQISNPSHQPHGYVQKKEEPKSIPHSGISQTFEPLWDFSGMESLFREADGCVLMKIR